MNYSIVDVKSGKKGRPAKLVKLADGTEVMLKVWVKTSEQGKAYAKELRKAKKVASQVSAPVETAVESVVEAPVAPTAPIAESVGIGA